MPTWTQYVPLGQLTGRMISPYTPARMEAQQCVQVHSAFCRCFVWCVASDVKGADLALWWAGRWHCRNTRDVNPDVEQAGGSAIGTELHAVKVARRIEAEKKSWGP